MSRAKHRAGAVLVSVGSILLAACGAAGSPASAPRQAAWPTKAITLISDSAAGSPKDVLIREMAKTLKAEHPKWNVVVEDKVGGDGAAALGYLLSQPADGYNWVVESGSFEVALSTSLAKSFSLSQFDFIARTDHEAFVLATNPSLHIRDWAALVRYAKTHRLTVTGFGQNSLEHYAVARLAKSGGFPYAWVPYGSGGKAVTAVMGGSSDAVMVDASAAAPYIRAGKLDGVLVTSAAPLSILPGVPSVVKLGYRDDVVYIWHGVFVKAGTPAGVVAAIDRAVAALPNNAGYRAFLKSSGITWGYQPAKQFNRTVRADVARIRGSLSLLKAQ
jgi:tripartite-type tricarboxylate transporter receptor subunit TctC